MTQPPNPYDALHGLTDAEWRAALMQSVTQPMVRGVRLPGFPAEGTQVLFTSHKNEAALDEALRFRDVVKRAGAEYGLGWSRDTRLLDFGVGWGRISRTFLPDVIPENLHGVDINPEILRQCSALMPYGTYALCHAGKPLDVAPNSFDVVVAFSVFSHLSEKNHLQWLAQFHRALKPGGIAVFTTLSRRFFHQCHHALLEPEASVFNQQLAALVRAKKVKGFTGNFFDFPPERFFYLPTGGGIAGTDAQDYGWALISRAYAAQRWARWFEVCEHVDVLSPLDQAVFVVRKHKHPAPLRALRKGAPRAWTGLKAVRRALKR